MKTSKMKLYIDYKKRETYGYLYILTKVINPMKIWGHKSLLQNYSHLQQQQKKHMVIKVRQ